MIPIGSISHAAGLLFGVADAVKVLAPPKLREKLAQRAGRVLAFYAESKSGEAHLPTTGT